MIYNASLWLVLSCLMLSTGGQALAAFRSGSPTDGRSVDLVSWGRKFGLATTYSKGANQIQLRNKWASLSFDLASRKAWINGVQVWLSYPVRPSGGAYQVFEADLTNLFEPVLKPGKLPPGRKIRTIAIDAGHGGKDPGFERGNQAEKKHTLALALVLKEMLEEAGFKVVLTRRDDDYVDRDARPEIARRARADLFVSLHFNSSTEEKESVKGIETFVLTPHGAPPSSGSEPMRRFWPGHRTAAESSLLAYMVHKAAVKSLSLHDRGVKKAGFEVLRLAEMPAILIEGGFMSNTEDARRIFSPPKRAELARAIVDGILDYRRAVERTSGIGDEG